MNTSQAAISGVALPVNHAQEADADRIIVQKVQAGDVAAFDVLIRKYRERVFSIVYNMTSNREDASDLTQDVFIKAFRSIKSFKNQSSFFTWLYRITMNTTYSNLRKHRFRRFFSLETMDEEGMPPEMVEALSADSESEKTSFLKELQERLNEALQKLSINHRTVVVLFEIEGLSHAEIAQIMDTSEGTVRSRLHYAKQQLQVFLKDYLP